ncbi:uncharacterized protein LOC111240873, partial [Vigna radiata var. radiata]|uniref:Uncharacterized protein LOC111240873 n=1 Tax=Vigna radiata var. radiata TaxID=3916 RepID=A0A3Q0ELK9_VIGRR
MEAQEELKRKRTRDQDAEEEAKRIKENEDVEDIVYLDPADDPLDISNLSRRTSTTSLQDFFSPQIREEENDVEFDVAAAEWARVQSLQEELQRYYQDSKQGKRATQKTRKTDEFYTGVTKRLIAKIRKLEQVLEVTRSNQANTQASQRENEIQLILAEENRKREADMEKILNAIMEQKEIENKNRKYLQTQQVQMRLQLEKMEKEMKEIKEANKKKEVTTEVIEKVVHEALGKVMAEKGESIIKQKPIEDAIKKGLSSVQEAVITHCKRLEGPWETVEKKRQKKGPKTTHEKIEEQIKAPSPDTIRMVVKSKKATRGEKVVKEIQDTAEPIRGNLKVKKM